VRGARAALQALAAASLISVAGCAAVGGARGGAAARLPGTPEARAAWEDLVAGEDQRADQALRAARGRTPADPLALFADAALAWERGQDERALGSTLALLEAAAASGDARAGWLATAAATRLGPLLLAVPNPRPWEERALAVARQALPWPARLVLEDASDGVARRRGDAALLADARRRDGCLVAVDWIASIGRLPHRDLGAPMPEPRPPRRRLDAAGCRLALPAREGVPGVRVLAARVEVPAAGAGLYLDFAGPARVRVDGGRWQQHHFGDRNGPRWSQVARDLRPGAHDVEVRLGTWGGPSALRLFLLPGRGQAGSPPPAGDGPAGALWALVGALEHDLRGDVDGMLERLPALVARRRFALGLAAAAALTARDITRPSAQTRDEAQELQRQAVALDPRLARVYLELARGELERDQPGEAVALAERARAAAPGWWPAAMTAIEALRARGFEQQADAVLGEAIAGLGAAEGVCPLVLAAQQRASGRHRVAEEEALVRRLYRCDAQSSALVDWLRQRGDLAGAAAAVERALALGSDGVGLRGDLASLRLGQGDALAAARTLRAAIELHPQDASLRVRLADAWQAAGRASLARAVLVDTVRAFSGEESVRQVGRLEGLALPLDRFRQDGQAVIAEYRKANKSYAAPAVLVLDRTVVRVMEDGTQAILTHNIVNVQSKDGIARWGEVQIPEGAEILALRTHKADGRVREAEEIVGKSAISAPELGAGDFVEWETVEYREPPDAFSPGFVSDRFYFQSVELPLHLSEFVVVVPSARVVEADARAGAPTPEVGPGPEPDTRRYRYVARQMPQLFRERAAVPAIEWIPSVRLSSGLSIRGWMRTVTEQLEGIARSSPALRELAASIVAPARAAARGRPTPGRAPAGQAAEERQAAQDAIVRWVAEHIEPEAAITEPATMTLARRRGNRAGLIVALARAAGLPAGLALARSPTVAPAEAPPQPQELDDFAEVLVRFPGHGRAPARYVDPRWRHAAPGYLPPALDGSLCVVLDDGRFERAHSAAPDGRAVSLRLDLGADGGGDGTVVETLTGWPAIEWAEALARAGQDDNKLRQDFEQRWLGHHFPGARLGGLAIDVDRATPGRARLRYSFSSPQLAVASGPELKLEPTFFRAQPGRRYATERRRRTDLMLGGDIPLDVDARILLPAGAELVSAGDGGTVTAGGGDRGVRLLERRESKTTGRGAGARVEVHLQRQARAPLQRVVPAGYEAVAVELRRMDQLEQREIRFRVPAARPAAGR
jgi:tetratricopeptide (TPR) repeat protein